MLVYYCCNTKQTCFLISNLTHNEIQISVNEFPLQSRLMRRSICNTNNVQTVFREKSYKTRGNYVSGNAYKEANTISKEIDIYKIDKIMLQYLLFLHIIHEVY